MRFKSVFYRCVSVQTLWMLKLDFFSGPPSVMFVTGVVTFLMPTSLPQQTMQVGLWCLDKQVWSDHLQIIGRTVCSREKNKSDFTAVWTRFPSSLVADCAAVFSQSVDSLISRLLDIFLFAKLGHTGWTVEARLHLSVVSGAFESLYTLGPDSQTLWCCWNKTLYIILTSKIT